MLNHMIAWKGWILGPTLPDADLAGPTKSEFATFERMVLKAPSLKLVPTEDSKKLH